MTTKTNPCRCLIRHARTPEERRAVSETLEYSRSIGDSLGIMLALGQLSPCPKAKTDGPA